MILNIIFLFPENTPFLFKHVYPNVLNKRRAFPTNMASIVMAILKATVGKLLDKGRKMVADRLEEGDVTDEQFRAMTVGEIDEIKSKLEGIATGAPNDNFSENICSEDDLRSRIFGTFVVKFLACLPLLGFSNI